MKKMLFLRWPMWIILALAALAAFVPAFTFLYGSRPGLAHASGGTPTLSMPKVVHPYEAVTITGQGFSPNDQVSIIIDYLQNTPIGTLACDLNGNCSGQITIPDSYVSQGIHQIIGTAMSGLSAQTSTTFLPAISVTIYASKQKSSGPGTGLEAVGGAFMPNESISLSWGNESLGMVTTYGGGSFSFDFSAPTNIAPGVYTITATRTNQKPATVTTIFTILPPRLRSSASVSNTQPVHIQLAGFQASEPVALSWNANGGQSITTINVDGTGTIDTYIAVPYAPPGSYILTATSTNSGLHATSKLAIGPGILLTPNTVNPGGSITVSGGGFIPGETVNVYFQSPANGVTPVVIDNAGSFSVSLTIPVAHKQNVSYYVYAVSTTSDDKAKAQVFYH